MVALLAICCIADFYALRWGISLDSFCAWWFSWSGCYNRCLHVFLVLSDEQTEYSNKWNRRYDLSYLHFASVFLLCGVAKGKMLKFLSFSYYVTYVLPVIYLKFLYFTIFVIWVNFWFENTNFIKWFISTQTSQSVLP